jgi:CubicO group peptidase (beta-lactamase class C family)
MDKNHVKGLSLALVDGSTLVWSSGFGVADEKKKTPATAETLYMAGGLSKIVTAAEVLRLVERKKMKMDDPLEAYVPEFSIRSRYLPSAKITVKSLLAHHSGLPAYYLKGMMSLQPMSLEQLVEGLKKDSLVEEPQSRFRFSYLDYDLLGRALEKIQGGNFQELMKRDLLMPLGMDSSDFEVTPALEAKLAKGYLKGKTMPLTRMRDVPVSGMATTANDMAKFLSAILSGHTGNGERWMKEKRVASMFIPPYPAVPLDFGQEVGLGWMLGGWDLPKEEKVAWHEGSLSPYCSEMAVLYQRGLGVVVLSNTSEAKKIEKDITERALKLLLGAKFGVKVQLMAPQKHAYKEIDVEPESLEPYAGLYSALGQATPIERHGRRLSMRFFNAGINLLPVGGSLFMPRIKFLLFFHYDFPEFTLKFNQVEGKQVAVLDGFSIPVVFEKFDPRPIPPSWESRLGTYTLDNPDDLVTVSNVVLSDAKGVLTASVKFDNKPYNVKGYKYDLAFQPLSDDEAIVPGLFLTDGETLRAVEAGGKTKLFYSGYWFTKK